MPAEWMTHRALIFIILSLLTTTAPLPKYSEGRLAATTLITTTAVTTFCNSLWGRVDYKSKNKGHTMPGIQIESKKKKYY